MTALSPTVIQNYRRAVGNTFSVSVEVTGLSDEITAAYFSCKANASDQSYVFQKTLEDGVSVGTDDVIRFVASPEDTAVSAGRYVYDCTIVYGTDVLTLVTGYIDFLQIPTVIESEEEE